MNAQQTSNDWELALFYDFMFKPGPKCLAKLDQTGRHCTRNRRHKGHHAYIGSKSIVTWERKKGGSK